MNIIKTMNSTVHTTALLKSLTAPKTPLEAPITTFSPILSGSDPRNRGNTLTIPRETVIEPVFDRPRIITTVFRILPSHAPRVCLLIELIIPVILCRQMEVLPRAFIMTPLTLPGLPNLFLICSEQAPSFILNALFGAPWPLVSTTESTALIERPQVLSPPGL